MHTRASSYELIEPLPEPERTLNRRHHRRSRRVPYDQRNNPPQHPRIVYLPILNINHFCYFLATLENLYPMDDEPLWVADRVVAPTLGSAITIPETANEFAIKAGGILLYKTLNQAYQLLEDKVLLKLDWAKNQKTKPSLKKTIAFADKGSSNFDTDKIMARMDSMTLKMDAQNKELQTHAKKTKPDLNKDDIPTIDVIDEILEEDFDALLDEGRKILHSIEGTLLEEEIFAEFDEFMAMTTDINSDSESDTKEQPFEKITINTDYKIKTSLEEPPTNLKLKPL
nr:reverse transcriptase domain-containing protein [Tanacetum cinerariifolium]